MKKSLLTILLGTAIAMQSVTFTANTYAEASLNVVQVCFDKYYDDEDVTEITLTEGETVQLVLPEQTDMPEIDYIAFSTSHQGAVVTQDLKLSGLSAGEEHISVYVGYKGISHQDVVNIEAHIVKNDSISAETRKELDRLEKLDGYYRRRMELLGIIDENAPRLDMDKVQEIIDTSEDYLDIFARLNEYHIIADQKPDGESRTSYTYWFDDKGNETVTWYLEQDMIAYCKTNEKGIAEEFQMLYPEKSELYTGGKDINIEYMQYNQVKPEGTGKLTLTIIDGSTGQPFTETNGTFQLISKLCDEDGNVTEEVYKSWNISDGTTVSIDELPMNYSYELRYIDEYHEDENGELYKYEVDKDKGTHSYSFGYVPKEYKFNVYLKRQYKNAPIYIGQSVKGDINGDGVFSVADLVLFQKWLLGDKTVILDKNKSNADFCKDGVLDVYDLCLMRNELIK